VTASTVGNSASVRRKGVSFAQVVQQAIAAQVPALSIKAGKFFVEQALDTDSKAQALIESL